MIFAPIPVLRPACIGEFEFSRSEGCRQDGERLGGRGLLAFDVALGYRSLLHAEEWLAGRAVQQEQMPGLGAHRDGVSACGCDQRWL